MSQQTTHLYEFGPFRIDTKNRLLFRDGQPIPLKPKVVDTLLVLIENSGRVLDKDELIQTLWPDTFVEEGNLTQNIYVLRKALSNDSNGEPYIETIPRRGYRFAGQVKKLAGEEDRPSTIPPTGWTHLLSNRWVWLSAAVVVILLAVGLYRLLPTQPRSAGANLEVKTLAVLPFKALDTSGDDYIGQGMADALITKLSNIRQVTVRPTSAVLRYSGNSEDPLAAGRALNVESVLDGKVQRAGDRVRVTVQLLRVADGASLWAEQYDEQFTNIFALQDSISAQAARSLTLQLTGGETALMRKHATENAAAYDEYLQGRFFWNKRNTAGFKKAIEHFERALAVDPDYALAYAGLADCYIRLNDYDAPMAQESVPKGREAVTKALAIDDSLAEAHATLGFIKFRHDWDFPGAEIEFKRSLQLDPNYSEAHQWYAFYLLAVGRADEADVEMKRAQDLDPLSVSLNSNLSLHLFFRHKFDQSVQQSLKTLEMEPNHFPTRVTLGLNFEQLGLNKQAIEELKKAQALAPNDAGTIAALAHIFSKDGEPKDARDVLVELENWSKKNYVMPYSIAILHAGLGENAKALEWLERGFQDRSLRPVWLLYDPRLEGLRKDPRYVRLVQAMGLA